MSDKRMIYAEDAIDAVLKVIPDDEYWMEQVEKAINVLQPAQPEIIRCKDCKHKPYPSDNYDFDNGDCGFEIIFPDYRCPCQCEDGYYNRIPDDDWFCADGERREK